MTNSLEQRKKYTFSTIVHDYGEGVKRLLYTYVKDWSLVEDLLQEVFITVYEKFDSFRGESSLKTWVYKIAVNKAKDFVNSWHFRKVFFTEKLFNHSTNESPEIIALYNQQKSELSNAVFALPIKYREVIILHYYQEEKIEVISEILEVNPSTIKTRLSRARDLLNKKLGGHFYEES